MRIDVLGVGFDNLTLDETIRAGAALVEQGGFHYAVTPNPEFVLNARDNTAFREALNGADLSMPDGTGVVLASKLLGRPLKERVPGIDFAAGLLAWLGKRGGRVFLLGSKPGIAEQAAVKLAGQYPGLIVCGAHDGYFKEDPPIVAEIRAAAPDVLLVGLGAPKQELWMIKNGPDTGASLMVGLGGALDVFAGVTERAPERWQRMGLEWLYRLIKEPSRIGRMARLPLILTAAAGARLRGK